MPLHHATYTVDCESFVSHVQVFNIFYAIPLTYRIDVLLLYNCFRWEVCRISHDPPLQKALWFPIGTG